MSDLRFRFNPETDDVEIVLNDKVVDTVGQEVVESWMNAYNNKHGFVKPEEQTTEAEKDESKQEPDKED